MGPFSNRLFDSTLCWLSAPGDEVRKFVSGGTWASEESWTSVSVWGVTELVLEIGTVGVSANVVLGANGTDAGFGPVATPSLKWNPANLTPPNLLRTSGVWKGLELIRNVKLLVPFAFALVLTLRTTVYLAWAGGAPGRWGTRGWNGTFQLEIKL